MERVVRLTVSMRRSSDLVEVAVISDETWDKIQLAIEKGINVSLGEVAGKHSDVNVVFEPEDFEILSQDQNDCEVLKRLVRGHVGLYMIDSILEALNYQ